MTLLKKMALDLVRSEDGTSVIEYAITASVMAPVLAAASPGLGVKVRGL